MPSPPLLKVRIRNIQSESCLSTRKPAGTEKE